MAGILRGNGLGPPLIAVAAALAGNAAVGALGLEGVAADPDPPGWLIGGVWTLIFAGFGASYAALRRASAALSRERAALVGLGLLCLAYPAYTAGFALTSVALAGAVVTLVYAAGLIVWFWPASRPAALWLAPLPPWLAFATWTLT